MTFSKALIALSCLIYSVVSFANVTKIKIGELDVIQVSADTGKTALKVARASIPADFREYKEYMSSITGCDLGFSYQESKDICMNKRGDIGTVVVFLPVTLK